MITSRSSPCTFSITTTQNKPNYLDFLDTIRSFAPYTCSHLILVRFMCFQTPCQLLINSEPEYATQIRRYKQMFCSTIRIYEQKWIIVYIYCKVKTTLAINHMMPDISQQAFKFIIVLLLFPCDSFDALQMGPCFHQCSFCERIFTSISEGTQRRGSESTESSV